MFIYNNVLRLYVLIIHIVSLWVPKAKLWVDGRKDLFERLSAAIPKGERIIWVHVASLGEFEQGRPIIERIRSEKPHYKILLTFFSPSGYEIRKGYEGVDYIFYLPIDTSSNARRFLDIVNPEIAIFVKYEYWINLLRGLSERGSKIYIISSIFRRNSIFFKFYGCKWRAILRKFNKIFVQDESSKKLLSELGIVNSVVVAGDTRFDRVAQIAKNRVEIKPIEQFKAGGDLMVVGSSWAADEGIIIPLIRENQGFKFIIAPHEIDSHRIESLEKSLEGLSVVRYSACQGEDLSSKQVLILDTMGMLSSVYAYADLAYIGGGFGVGIHNTLEAATFGLPIAFGPKYQKFKEACDMVELGASHSVDSLDELRAWFSPLRDDKSYRYAISARSKGYAAANLGAADKIMAGIFGEL